MLVDRARTLALGLRRASLREPVEVVVVRARGGRVGRGRRAGRAGRAGRRLRRLHQIHHLLLVRVASAEARVLLDEVIHVEVIAEVTHRDGVRSRGATVAGGRACRAATKYGKKLRDRGFFEF